MLRLARLFLMLIGRLDDHERRLATLEKPAGPPSVISGTPQIKR